MFAATRGGGAATTRVLSFVASATSSAQTIVVPSSARSGDVLVLFDSAQNRQNTTGAFPAYPTATLPTGFSSVINATSQAEVFGGDEVSKRQLVSARVAAVGTAGSTLTGMVNDAGTSGSTSKILMVFRFPLGATTFTANDVEHQAPSGGNPSAQTVNASSGAAPLVVIGLFDQQNTASFSPAADGTVVQGVIRMSYKLYASSPQDVTVDVGDSALPFLGSFYLTISS